MLTIGHRRHRGHPLDDRVIEDACSEHSVIAGHHPSDVLDGLTHIEADLLAARVHGMPAELDDGHLHRLTCAIGRLLEDQRDTRAGSAPVAGRCARRGASTWTSSSAVKSVMLSRCLIIARTVGDDRNGFVELRLGDGQRWGEPQRRRA